MKKMRKEYPSDITREQFEMIREELENSKKRHIQENMICMTYFVQYYIC